MSISRVACSIIVFALAGYGETPRLVPRIVLPGEDVRPQFWLSAPLIAVVRITEAEWVGQEVEVAGPTLKVRLIKFSAEVEMPIKGNIPVGSISFYHFGNTQRMGSALSGTRYWLSRDERHIVFLRKDKKVYRTMADIEEMKARVLGGRQPRPYSLDPALTIAHILLVPIAYERGFASRLMLDYPDLMLFVSKTHLVNLVEPLLAHQDPEIKEAACVVLNEYNYFRHACLDGALRSKDDGIRTRASRIVRAQSRADPVILEKLTNRPDEFQVPGSLDSLVQEIELFRYDRSQRVRAAACDTVRKLGRAENSSVCVAAAR